MAKENFETNLINLEKIVLELEEREFIFRRFS